MTKDNRYTASYFSDKDITLEIPIYQRLFVWDENQINCLLFDLLEALIKNSSKEYHIGMITAVEKEDNRIWEIVDGQQRLSFLTLLATQLSSIDSRWDTFLYKEDKEQRINYVGRSKDMEDIKRISSTDYELINISNKHFQIFINCFNNFKQLLKEREQDISSFSSYVFEKVVFLASWLDNEYSSTELNEYFENLNVAGKQLEPEEIIKGKFFANYASQWNQLIDFSNENIDISLTALNTEETTILEILNTDTNLLEDDKRKFILTEPAGEKIKTTIRSILSLPVFLLHVLRLTINNKVNLNPRKLIEVFEKNKQNFEIESFMKNMISYRKWLDENIIIQTDDGFSFKKFNKEDIDKSVETNDDKKMLHFQSMLTVSSSENQEWVLQAYTESKDKKLQLDLLKSQDKERHSFSNNESFEYPNINRYWFWKLDYILWEKFMDNHDSLNVYIESKLDDKEKTLIKNYKFTTNRSIEHLHPQTSEDSWNFENLHSFGNLAMISASFNSAQSNDTIGVKFGRVKDASKLESIKMLLMFKLANGENDKWTIDKAKNHGETMLELIKKY